jgi:hypothetical protein
VSQFSEKTEKIIVEDMKEIQKLAKEIVKHCDKCLKMVKQSYVGNDEWANETSEIVRCYEQIEWIMEEKRGRF